MIKYLGSKRLLVPVLGAIAQASGASSAVDLFTGTTRVAQEFKRLGITVTACDLASYSKVLAQCFIETNADEVADAQLQEIITSLNNLPAEPGYFTKTFCQESRFFQPKNGARVDAIRNELERTYAGSKWFPILLTSLILAADKVDSTTGLQMAYLKKWAPRSYHDLELLPPRLLSGPGRAVWGDACQLVSVLDSVDLMYIDPPYNQHRYFTNYHVWETLVRWDHPRAYGVARKRLDAREEHTKSVFNSKKTMPEAFRQLLLSAKATTLVVSYNDESWVSPKQIISWLKTAGYQKVELLAFDYKRYVGAQIGIFNPSGEKVGNISHLHNQEYIFIAGPSNIVDSSTKAAIQASR